MVKEFNINGKRVRYYQEGKIYISDDGTLAAMPKTKEILPIKTDTNGVVYVKHGWGHCVVIAKAVITCFCKPRPEDGKKYRIRHKDGNSSNCSYKNLEWEVEHYVHTTSPVKTITIEGTKLDVRNDGTVTLDDGTLLTVSDCIGDSDTDLMVCIEPHITIPRRSSHRGRTVTMDEIMKSAGFVNGDDAVLKDPVILHKDFDRMNFSEDNLEFVEKTDQRYSDYQKKKRKQTNIRGI